MSIGTNIKNLRDERNLTQDQLAEMVGVTFQAVSSWERDEYKPDTNNLINLAVGVEEEPAKIEGGWIEPWSILNEYNQNAGNIS